MALIKFSWEKEDTERNLILRAYKAMMRHAKDVSWAEKGKIRKAFEYAAEAHSGMRRKSGEPYILHPLAVARVLVEEVELDDPISIMCALLHDVVEDTEITLDDIEGEFGLTARNIIDGLTKIKGAGVFDETDSAQAENFRKILLTISDDIRVVLIKLADRLHNMRTLGSMKEVKMLKISSETLYLYAPLAHRLGLYNIKSELEDLAFKYSQPDLYDEIAGRLSIIEKEEQPYIDSFMESIKGQLKGAGLKFSIKNRFKSVYSINKKMQRQGVPFEEVFDLYAIRVILKTRPGLEQADCWRSYSIISEIYKPNPKRIRDWITVPKENGYESLHVTVMGPRGRWIEVQIRTERMDFVAEKGIASHWKYKTNGEQYDEGFNAWMTQVREILENPSLNALDAVKEFRENLQPNNVYVFTPKGDFIRIIPHSTVLDFAYKIHSRIGDTAIGAKVNNEVVALDYNLKPGDQVEVLTSKKQKPKEEWLHMVKTPRAREHIKRSLAQQRKDAIEVGRQLFEWRAQQYGLGEDNPEFMKELLAYFMQPSIEEFYFSLGMHQIAPQKIQDFVEFKKAGRTVDDESLAAWEQKIEFRKHQFKELGVNADDLVITEGQDFTRYKLAKCCSPISGDNIIGILKKDIIDIHRTSCPEAITLMSSFGPNIIQARWAEGRRIDFLASLKVVGLDKQGMLNDLIKVITFQMKLNIRKVAIESQDNMFEGIFHVYVHDTEELETLVNRITELPNVFTVSRTENDYQPFQDKD